MILNSTLAIINGARKISGKIVNDIPLSALPKNIILLNWTRGKKPKSRTFASPYLLCLFEIKIAENIRIQLIAGEWKTIFLSISIKNESTEKVNEKSEKQFKA